jgi:hypothetical protein
MTVTPAHRHGESGAMCGTRYLIATKGIAAGAPVRHIFSLPPEGNDTGFMLTEHMNGHGDDEFIPMCFDCALEIVDGRALDAARQLGEWHLESEAAPQN